MLENLILLKDFGYIRPGNEIAPQTSKDVFFSVFCLLCGVYDIRYIPGFLEIYLQANDDELFVCNFL